PGRRGELLQDLGQARFARVRAAGPEVQPRAGEAGRRADCPSGPPAVARIDLQDAVERFGRSWVKSRLYTNTTPLVSCPTPVGIAPRIPGHRLCESRSSWPLRWPDP